MTKVLDFRKIKNHKLKNKSIEAKHKRDLNYLKEEKYKVIFLLISVIGIFIGAFSYRFINTQLIQFIFDKLNVLNSGEFNTIFLYLFKLDLVFIILNFFVGTSFLGSAISFLAPTLKSVYIGFLSGYLYNEFELKGVLFSILLLYPCFVITTTSLIFASNENVYMSKYIFNCLNGKISIDNVSIKLYLIRYLLLFIIDIICISITSLMIMFIAPKINIL